MKKMVSVVIPNLNSIIIDRTIDALLSQTYRNRYEIIIVGKDSLNLIKPLKKVKFIETKEKKNPAEARNIGIGLAKGEDILFIDADTIPRKDWMKILINHKGKVVGGSVDFTSDNFWIFCDNFFHFYPQGINTKSGIRKSIGESIVSMNMKVPKELALKIGFDETLVTGEDLDFIAKIVKGGYNIYFEPRAIVNHYPDRRSFLSILKHAIIWNRNGIKVRFRHRELFKPPSFLENPYIFILLSPLISLIQTIRVFMSSKEYLKYIYLFPLAFLSKMAACIGCYWGLRNVRKTKVCNN